MGVSQGVRRLNCSPCGVTTTDHMVAYFVAPQSGNPQAYDTSVIAVILDFAVCTHLGNAFWVKIHHEELSVSVSIELLYPTCAGCTQVKCNRGGNL